MFYTPLLLQKKFLKIWIFFLMIGEYLEIQVPKLAN